MKPSILHHLVLVLLVSLSCQGEAIVAAPGPVGVSPSHTVSTATMTNATMTRSGSAASLMAVANDASALSENLALSLRICIHIFQLFSSLCLLSIQGYQVVLSVFSEVRDEQYRFERTLQRLQDLLTNTVAINDLQADDVSVFWECQVAAINLFNSIANTPETIDTRRSMQTELERRGLDQHLMVCNFWWNNLGDENADVVKFDRMWKNAKMCPRMSKKQCTCIWRPRRQIWSWSGKLKR